MGGWAGEKTEEQQWSRRQNRKPHSALAGGGGEEVMLRGHGGCGLDERVGRATM